MSSPTPTPTISATGSSMDPVDMSNFVKTFSPELQAPSPSAPAYFGAHPSGDASPIIKITTSSSTTTTTSATWHVLSMLPSAAGHDIHDMGSNVIGAAAAVGRAAREVHESATAAASAAAASATAAASAAAASAASLAHEVASRKSRPYLSNLYETPEVFVRVLITTIAQLHPYGTMANISVIEAFMDKLSKLNTELFRMEVHDNMAHEHSTRKIAGDMICNATATTTLKNGVEIPYDAAREAKKTLQTYYAMLQASINEVITCANKLASQASIPSSDRNPFMAFVKDATRGLRHALAPRDIKQLETAYIKAVIQAIQSHNSFKFIHAAFSKAHPVYYKSLVARSPNCVYSASSSSFSTTTFSVAAGGGGGSSA